MKRLKNPKLPSTPNRYFRSRIATNQQNSQQYQQGMQTLLARALSTGSGLSGSGGSSPDDLREKFGIGSVDPSQWKTPNNRRLPDWATGIEAAKGHFAAPNVGRDLSVGAAQARAFDATPEQKHELLVEAGHRPPGSTWPYDSSAPPSKPPGDPAFEGSMLTHDIENGQQNMMFSTLLGDALDFAKLGRGSLLGGGKRGV